MNSCIYSCVSPLMRLTIIHFCFLSFTRLSPPSLSHSLSLSHTQTLYSSVFYMHYIHIHTTPSLSIVFSFSQFISLSFHIYLYLYIKYLFASFALSLHRSSVNNSILLPLKMFPAIFNRNLANSIFSKYFIRIKSRCFVVVSDWNLWYVFIEYIIIVCANNAYVRLPTNNITYYTYNNYLPCVVLKHYYTI